MKNTIFSRIKTYFLVKMVMRNRTNVAKTYIRLLKHFLKCIVRWEYNDVTDIGDLKESIKCYDGNISEIETILLANYRNKIRIHEECKTQSFDDIKSHQIKERTKTQVDSDNSGPSTTDLYSDGYDDGFEKGKIDLANELIKTFSQMRDSSTSIEISSVIQILENRKTMSSR